MSPRRHLTLIEVTVSSGILAVLMVATFTLLVSTQEATMTTAASFDINEEARRAVRELRRELRQSGWEIADASQGDLWQGNQVLNPKPTDATVSTFGTPLSSADTVLRFRQRISFGGTTPDLEDWTNDDPGGTPTVQHYIVYQAIADGAFRNVPGGPIPRWTLVRSVGPLNAEVPLGTKIHNLENVTFYREDWDTVLVRLQFLFPHPSGQGANPPEPIRVKVTERIQLMNGSLNGT